MTESNATIERTSPQKATAVSVYISAPLNQPTTEPLTKQTVNCPTSEKEQPPVSAITTHPHNNEHDESLSKNSVLNLNTSTATNSTVANTANNAGESQLTISAMVASITRDKQLNAIENVLDSPLSSALLPAQAQTAQPSQVKNKENQSKQKALASRPPPVEIKPNPSAAAAATTGGNSNTISSSNTLPKTKKKEKQAKQKDLPMVPNSEAMLSGMTVGQASTLKPTKPKATGNKRQKVVTSSPIPVGAPAAPGLSNQASNFEIGIENLIIQKLLNIQERFQI